MSGMFHGCSSLKKLDLSNFNTEKLVDMSSMFNGCTNLEELAINNFNTVFHRFIPKKYIHFI